MKEFTFIIFFFGETCPTTMDLCGGNLPDVIARVLCLLNEKSQFIEKVEIYPKK